MSRIEKYIFFGFLALIFFFEGLGIAYGRIISLSLIILLPLILFLLSFKNKVKIEFPKTLSTLILSFFVFTTLSTVFSVNIITSLTFLVYYLAIFFIFIYTNHYKNDLSKPIFYFIFAATAAFCLFSIINNEFSIINITNGYQFISSF